MAGIAVPSLRGRLIGLTNRLRHGKRARGPFDDADRRFLADRGVVRVEGEDAPGFLQGLLTNDVESLPPGEARYAALLTPQGKILFDFLVLRAPGAPPAFLLDCPKALAADLAKRLASTSSGPRSPSATRAPTSASSPTGAARPRRRAPRLRRSARRRARPARHPAARRGRSARAGRARRLRGASHRRSACRRAASISPMATPSPTTPTWISSTASTSTRAATSARKSCRG